MKIKMNKTFKAHKAIARKMTCLMIIKYQRDASYSILYYFILFYFILFNLILISLTFLLFALSLSFIAI